MRLVSVTGFPRTGTTWMRDALRQGVNSCGDGYESGWVHLWDLSDKIVSMEETDEAFQRIEPLCESAAEETVVYSGLYYAHWVLSIGRVEFFDRIAQGKLAGTGKEIYVEKTPFVGKLSGYPFSYVKKSRVFDDFRCVICQRPWKEVWASMSEKFAHYSEERRDALSQQYASYYTTAGDWESLYPEQVRVVNHREMPFIYKDVAAWCGIEKPLARPWATSR